jgi:hypothetical protein
MTLTISNTICDEEIRTPATNPSPQTQPDEHDVPTATFDASAFKTALNAIAGLNFLTTTGFPQYAERTGFVAFTNPVTDFFLTSSATGTPFPATGTATSLKVGNTTIFLFPTSNPDIVVGRVGNEGGANPDTANASGAIALVIGVEETKTGGFVTSADMWIGLYAPMTHNGTNLVDFQDELDLSNLVWLGSNFDTTTNVPFSDFSDVPSGANLFNVIFPTENPADIQLLVTGSAGEALGTNQISQQGIGANGQHVEKGTTLRIDTVRGVNSDNVDESAENNQASNIDYAARVNMTAANFEITQTNANGKLADLRIDAFLAAGTSQEQAYLNNAIAADGAPIQIDAADVRILNAAGADITSTWDARAGTSITQSGDGVIVTGLLEDDRVAFTTDGVQFNRLLITNVDTKETFDVGNINVTVTQGGTSTEFAELGSHLKLQDDGPTLAADVNNTVDVNHDETPGLTDDDVAGTTVISGSTTVASLFANVSGANDPDVPPVSGPIGYARSNGALVTVMSGDAGADGPGANPLIYSLSVTNAAYSGVQTTGGTKIFLYNGSGTTEGLILGRVGNEVAAGDTPNATGDIAFALAVGAGTGEVFVAQYLSLLHPTGNDTSFDETISLAAGALNMTVARVDSEGDTVVDSDNDIGLQVKFDDDGPAIAGSPDPVNAPNDLVVKNLPNDPVAGTDSSSYVLTPGADGTKSFSILGIPDTSGAFKFSAYDVNGDSITGNNEIKGTYTVGSTTIDLYTLILNPDGTYTFDMIGALPNSTENLGTTVIHAGGPTDTVDVAAASGTDFGRIVADSTVGAGLVNASHGFVGVDNGNLDSGEQLNLSLHEANGDVIDVLGINVGTKSAGISHYDCFVTLSDNSVVQVADDLQVGKNGIIHVVDPNLNDNLLISSVTIFKVDGNAVKIGLGDIQFLLPPDDVQLSFDVRLTDGDNDFVNQSFTVSIDGNNDGSITSPISALAAANAASLAATSPASADSFANLRMDMHHDLFGM